MQVKYKMEIRTPNINVYRISGKQLAKAGPPGALLLADAVAVQLGHQPLNGSPTEMSIVIACMLLVHKCDTCALNTHTNTRRVDLQAEAKDRAAV